MHVLSTLSARRQSICLRSLRGDLFLALPNKPPDVDRGEVSVELFFREADDWTKLTKGIQIEGG